MDAPAAFSLESCDGFLIEPEVLIILGDTVVMNYCLCIILGVSSTLTPIRAAVSLNYEVFGDVFLGLCVRSIVGLIDLYICYIFRLFYK